MRNREYVIPDYTGGKRVRHVRVTEESAKTKAKEICEALANGKHDVMEWSQFERDRRRLLRYVTPVPEPTEAELAEVFKALDRGRRTRPITDDDESQIQEEIRKYRAEKRRHKG